MLRLLALLLSLAGPHSNPELDRLCEQRRPEATPGATLATAFAAAQKPPPCDLMAERGICLFAGTKVYIDALGGASIVPVEPLEADEYKERPIYVYTAFDTNAGDKKHAAAVWVDGKELVHGLPADQPIHVAGYLRRLSPTKWHHVAVVSSAGKVLGSVELDGNVQIVQAAKTDVTIGGSSGQDISSTSRVIEGYAELRGKVGVFYTVAVE